MLRLCLPDAKSSPRLLFPFATSCKEMCGLPTVCHIDHTVIWTIMKQIRYRLIQVARAYKVNLAIKSYHHAISLFSPTEICPL